MWTSHDIVFHKNGTIEECEGVSFSDETVERWRKDFTDPVWTWLILVDKPHFIVMRAVGREFVRFSINTRNAE